MDKIHEPPMIFADDFVVRENIGWRIEPAQQEPCNPLLEPKYPWESATPCSGHGTVLKDPIDGKYKAWVVAIEQLKDESDWQSGHLFRLVYLCSEDGLKWERPQLDISPYPGYPKTNIIFGFESGGRATYASVFVKPEENPDEPYEMFVYRDPGFRCPTFNVAGFKQKPLKSRADVYGPGGTYGLYRYRSPDGIHWRGVEGPLDFKSGDTLYVHRNPKGGYVGHHKDCVPAFPGGYVPYDIAGGQGCRITLRKTSPDGTHWSDSIPLMMPDWQDHGCDQFMEVGYYPYGSGIIGLTAVYHAAAQTMDLQFAASVDGLKWWRPSRVPCLALAPLGDYGSGMIWPTRTLIHDGDKMYVYYGALDGLHGDLYSQTPTAVHFHGAFCRASWDVGRMWAAVPGAGGKVREASLVTPVLETGGKNLYVNAVTIGDGEVAAELVEYSESEDCFKALPGFERDRCTAFRGDDKSAIMTWRGMEKCPLEKARVKLYLRQARLYGFKWR